MTRREKILVIGAVSFEVSGALLPRGISDLSLRSCLQTSFLSLRFLLSALCAVLSDLASMSCARQTFVCESNGRTSLELTRIQKFCIAVCTNDGTLAIPPFSTSELHLKT